MATAANPLQNSFQTARRRRPLPKWTESGRWTAIPHSYFEKAIPYFDGLAAGCLGLLLRYTVGERATDDWEWTAITQKKFATILDATENGIAKALDRLTESGVVLERTVGRKKEYRVSVEAIEKLTGRRPDKPKPPEPESDDHSSDNGAASGTEFAAPAASLAAARKRYGANAALVVLPGSDTMVPVESVCSQGSKCCLASGDCDAKQDSTPRLVSIQGGRAKDKTPDENKGVNAGKPQLQLGFPSEHQEAGEQFVEAVTEVFVAATHEPAPASLVEAQFMRIIDAQVDPDLVVKKVQSAAKRAKSWGLLARLVDDVIAANAGKAKEEDTAYRGRLTKGVLAVAKLIKPANTECAKELRDLAEKVPAMAHPAIDEKLNFIEKRLISALYQSLPAADRAEMDAANASEADALGGPSEAKKWLAVLRRQSLLSRFELPDLSAAEIWRYGA
jgi:hypothetical protein